MKKLNKSIFINAPAEKVWNTMLSDETYRKWTEAFNPGSHFQGKWEEGEKMLFLGPNPDGTPGEGGMVSRIKVVRPNEYVSIEHVGIVMNGVEDTESEEAKKWAPAYENYTFVEKDGGTEVSVDQDIEDQYKDEFDVMWDNALQRLKELCENN